MKPTPTSLKQFLTPSGPKAMFTPKDSSTSALPVDPDIARFPCLATGTPAPETTNAEAVEMLNQSSPLPPVPHVSIISRSVSTCNDTSRITLAMPASCLTSHDFAHSVGRLILFEISAFDDDLYCLLNVHLF
jgi:hypothetical protein